jgi:hypothetical protein
MDGPMHVIMHLDGHEIIMVGLCAAQSIGHLHDALCISLLAVAATACFQLRLCACISAKKMQNIRTKKLHMTKFQCSLSP